MDVGDCVVGIGPMLVGFMGALGAFFAGGEGVVDV